MSPDESETVTFLDVIFSSFIFSPSNLTSSSDFTITFSSNVPSGVAIINPFCTTSLPGVDVTSINFVL